MLICLCLTSRVQAVAPPAPTLIMVGKTIASNSEKGFVCQWIDNSSDEDLFEMRVRVGSVGAWVPVNYFLTNAQFGTWYASNRFLVNVKEGETLFFNVVACHADIVRDQTTNQITDFTVTERSVPSATMSVIYTKVASDLVLHPPTDFQLTVVNDGKLSLAWKDGTVTGSTQQRSMVEDGFSFFVKESTAASYPSTEGFSLPFDIQQFTLQAYNVQTGTNAYGLLPGHSYVMKVRAVQGSTVSTFSNEVPFTMPPLNAPTNLTVTPIDERSMRMTWLDNSDNEHGYVIQIEVGAPFGDITWDSVAANTTSFIIRNLIPGTAAKWKVTGAFNPGNNQAYISSLPSNVVEQGTTMPAPTGLTATTSYDAQNSTTVTALSWSETAQTEDGVGVFQRRTGTTDAFVLVKKLPPNATSTTLTNDLFAGASVDVIVRDYALNNSNEVAGGSPDSNVVVVSTRDGFTSGTQAAAAFGASFSYTLATSTSSPRTGWAVSGLPLGLTFNDGSGVISGSPSESGVFVAQLTATFANGWTARSTLTLRIAPTGTSAPVATPTSKTLNTTKVSVPLSSLFRDPDAEQAVRITTTLGAIDLVLYPSLTPATVANFLAYANAGDYNGTAFHRVSPGFVLQGGGYKFTTAPDNFAEVTKRPSPINEPGIRNLQWTVAMAKGADPDSASHDFFFNLVDNPSLDTSNGGFSVFGRVVQGTASRDVVTAITGKPGKKYKIKLTPSGSTTPVADFDPLSGLGDNEFWPLNVTAPAPDTIDATKLITIQNVAPLPVMTYALLNTPSAATATAEIVNGELQLTGVADGSTSLTVRATDVDGQQTDLTIPITVNTAFVYPSITTQPQPVTAAVGGAASFSVTATGDGLSYQWRRNGQNLSGQTASSLSLASLQAGDAGQYDVVVSNAGTSLTSSSVLLNVLIAPSVVTPPAHLTRNYGSSATFTVVAAGSSLSYQWRKHGTPIPLATSASLTLSPLLLTDAEDYDVVVSNVLSTATSAAATLTVLRVDTDGDGLYDDDEVARVLPPTNSDADGDGASDGAEIMLGTNPKLATSKPDAFLSQRDRTAAISSIGLKRLIGGAFTDALNGNAAITVPDQWLGTHELTNEQFAGLLHHAVRVQNVAEIVSSSGRRFVRYPKTTGEIVCYLKDSVTSPPSCDITADELGTTFVVAKADAKLPVRAVSWFGGYLATHVLNSIQGYPTKNLLPTWSWSSDAGWSLPAFTTWGWAARGGISAFAYPTGATVTTKLAALADLSPTAKPKNVGSYAASKLGYFDLAGNVAEWMAEGNATNSYTRGAAFNSPLMDAANSAWTTTAKTTLSAQVGVRLVLNETLATRIITQPISKFLRTGSPLQLSVTAAGAPPLRYQWLLNGKPLAGQTASMLQVASAALANGGAYTVTVTGGGGIVTSNAASVTMIEVPTGFPTPVYVAPNAKTQFTVKVAKPATTTLTYRWVRPLQDLTNDYTVHGVDKQTLQIGSAQQGMSDSYVCQVGLADQPLVAPIDVTFAMIVYDLPEITPPSRLPYAVVGTPFDYQVPFSTEDERKITKWTITGLPDGLIFNPLTGRITGTPTVGKTSNVTITATNPFGSVTESVTFTVQNLPNHTASAWLAPIPRGVLNNQLGGRLDLKATGTGNVSGSVTLGQTNYPFKGRIATTVNSTTGAIGTNVSGTITVARKGLSSLRLTVSLTPNIDGFAATLSELPALTNTLSFNGWRSICDADVSATTAGRFGLHNVALAAPATSTDPATVPQGVSVNTISIVDNGTTTFAGQLPDGTVVTTTGLLGPEQVLVYSPLYAGKGSLLGTLRVAEGFAQTVRIGATESVTWFKQPITGDTNYAAGFGPLTMRCLGGAKHVPPTVGTLLVGTVSTTTANVQLDFTSGGLAASFSQPLLLNTKHLAASPGANPKTVSLTVVPSTGKFSGRFTLTDTAKPRTIDYFGIIVPHPTDPLKNVGYGYFRLPQVSVGGSTIGQPIWSGRVDFIGL